MMKAKGRKKQLPRPKPYKLSGSVQVPEFEGPWGMPMDSVRVQHKGACMSGDPDHRVCVRHLMAARERYLASLNLVEQA